ncbi:MAG TPA: FAD-dependent oxidoreductase [Acetobacteraceae bacterium]|nr:FAD-dependent oxidoreductase [Acetobacteraceae bacterium]
MPHFDYLVIGGGAAGLSVAYELAKVAAVVLVEREIAPGYHSTGRSAAVIAENYGPLGWRTLVTASRPFFEAPPAGFADHPLLHRIGALYFAGRDDEAGLVESARALEQRNVEYRLLPAGEARALCPVVKADDFSMALLEPGCADIDAHALLQGYLRLARANGLNVLLATEAASLERRGGRWHLATPEMDLTASAVVNTAGAWADEVARRAGLQPKGLLPYRRTAITFDPPAGADVRGWPMTFDVAQNWYFKPEAGRVMASPVDKTATEPCDAAPEEFDVAVAIDRIERATTMSVARVHSKWAGLRTFAPDEQPVIGADPDEPSFFWLAGQGGNGVMGAPAAAELAAAIATGSNLPEFVARCGVDLDAIAPGRFQGRKA